MGSDSVQISTDQAFLDSGASGIIMPDADATAVNEVALHLCLDLPLLPGALRYRQQSEPNMRHKGSLR